MPNREELRRREAEVAGGIANAYGSGNPFGLPTESAASFLSESIALNPYPTQSVDNYPTQSAGNSFPTGGAASSGQGGAATSAGGPASTASPPSSQAGPPTITVQPLPATSAPPASNVTTANGPSSTGPGLPVFTGHGSSISLSIAFIGTTFAVAASLLL